MFFFFLITRLPPRSTLFYTTLFRSPFAPQSWRVGGCGPHRFLNVIDSQRRLQQNVKTDEAQKGQSEHMRSEEHTSELQSHSDLVCRLLLEKKKKRRATHTHISRSLF